jgi:hypothetical protein
VVPLSLSRAAITLATSVPWGLVGGACAGSQRTPEGLVNCLQRQRSPTRPARSATPVATPVSTTATVRPAPLAPPWWAWTTLAPGRGWRCQQRPGSQASTRRTQSGSA